MKAMGAALTWGAVVAVVMLFWAWQRQLPWVNVLVLFAGTAVCLGVVGAGLGFLQEAKWPAFGPLTQGVVLQMPCHLVARLVAQDLWAWRAGRPRYGYELMALTCVLVVWQLVWVWGMQPGVGNGLGLGLALVLAGAVVWQVMLTPWLIRKSPAPAPRDWLGPLVWLGWTSWGWWVLPYPWRGESGWRWLLTAAPGLLAWLPQRWLSAARARPGPV